MRPLQVGDRVIAYGTVSARQTMPDMVCVKWDRGGPSSWLAEHIPDLVHHAEPPVGSVVLVNGNAWTRHRDDTQPWYTPADVEPHYRDWSDLIRGRDFDILFRAGDDA